MRVLCVLITAALSVGAASQSAQPPSPPQPTPATVATAMDESVAAYRKIIVLMDNSSALDEGNRERVHTAAWIQFEQNRDRLEKVEEDLHADVVNTSSPLTDAFLT